jgi:hypothetical protein
MNSEFVSGDELLQRAEACRAEAVSRSGEFSELQGQPSAWCVIMQGTIFGYSYLLPCMEKVLRDRVARGDRVVAIIGAVINIRNYLKNRHSWRSKEGECLAYAADFALPLGDHQQRKIVDIAVRRIASHCARHGSEFGTPPDDLRAGLRQLEQSPKRSDSPALFRMFSAFFAAFTLLILLTAHTELARESDLRPVVGTVQRVHLPRPGAPGRRGPAAQIFVLGSDGVHDLAMEHYGDDAHGLMNLRVGDIVTARVKHDFMGRDLEWLWELQRGGATLLSYQDVNRDAEGRYAFGLKMSFWMGAIAVGLFAIASLLRWHYGAWSRKG